MSVPGVVQADNSGAALQGSSPNLQGSSPNLQNTWNPQGGVPYGGYVAPVAPPPKFFAADGSAWSSPGEAVQRTADLHAVDVSQDSIGAGGRVQVNQLVTGYDDKVRAYLKGIEQGTENLNTGRANNRLNLRRARTSINSGVRQGLRSTGVSLANMNALDSGAASAAAKAWARSGNLQTGSALNQASLKENEFGSMQRLLSTDREEGNLSLNRYQATEADRISQQTQSQLQELDAQAQAKGISGRVRLALRDEIINDALRRIGEIDAMKDTRLTAAHLFTPEEAEARAVELDTQGIPSELPFTTNGVDVNLTGEGPALSQLPIYLRRAREEG